MASAIPLMFAGLVVGLPHAILAQEPSPQMRIEAQEIYLRDRASLNHSSARNAAAEILRSAQRAGGMVSLAGCEEPDRVPFSTAVSSSVAGALDLLTATYPEYYWTIQDGAVDILPKRNSPAVMDLRLQHIEWDTTASVQLSLHQVFDAAAFKSLLAKLGITGGLEDGFGLQRPPRVINGVPEPPAKGRKYTLENVTVLAALNAIIGSYESAFWWYEERTCDGKTTDRSFAQDLRRPK